MKFDFDKLKLLAIASSALALVSTLFSSYVDDAKTEKLIDEKIDERLADLQENKTGES